VEKEASDIWCPNSGDLKTLVKCFIFIGMGNPGVKEVEDNMFKLLSKTLVQISTETEETAKKFIARWRQHYDSNRYFRFNVDQGLQDVGLAQHTKRGNVKVVTDEYLEHQAQTFQMRDCVKNLRSKRSGYYADFS
jgi:hypothetical protein